jgi:hypothetical protein
MFALATRALLVVEPKSRPNKKTRLPRLELKVFTEVLSINECDKLSV